MAQTLPVQMGTSLLISRFFRGRLHSLLELIFLALLWPLNLRAESWARIGDDLELKKVDLTPASFLSSELYVFRTTLSRLSIRTLRAKDFNRATSDAGTICKMSKALLCVNANFFDEQGQALGLVVERGTTLHPLHRGGNTLTGVFQVGRHEVSIIHRSLYKAGQAIEAVQAGPRIISGGTIVPVNDQSVSRRAGVCIDSHERLILYLVQSRFSGSTILELQEALLQPGIDCKEALNLDGGGSAQLFVTASLPGRASSWSELNLNGRDQVPVFLGLFLK